MKSDASASSVARLQAITHRYGSTKALDSVTLEIPAARMVGLIGPDGVGKSTLLGLIAGVRKIQNGCVVALGGDMGEALHRRCVCPRIAYMPQGLGGNLYPDLSVVESIDFFGRLFGQSGTERRWRIGELLESTGLTPFAGWRERNLSGGMKQKLGLCCSLIHDPDLLILDEPTTGVDPLSRRQFWELIDRMQSRRQGMSVVVATAYMEEADRFDWLVMMDAGRVLATGTPSELKARAEATTLEEAYVKLLPERRRRGHRTFATPPRSAFGTELVIEAENLTRRFGDFTAVDCASFRIERGEIFGFLGPNGCGKTTTMKMLTGLLPATEGTARLFGSEVEAGDRELRRLVGYMSQSFSLYTELTVGQNLELHARLFHLTKTAMEKRISDLLERFGLSEVIDELAAKLPMGLRQRLSLAVAVIHEPEILILDEPTSGVDPLARDQFWELLIDLARNRGVTIFVSTHFMNEGARCDRIALMNAGRVLACDAPSALIAAKGAGTLEDAFIAFIREDRSAEVPERAGDDVASQASRTETPPNQGAGKPAPGWPRLPGLGRLLAYSRREILELRRDPIRLGICFLAPVFLLLVLGYGISLDVEDLPYAVLDRDRTPESRTYLENYAGSRYFEEQPLIASYTDLERRLRSGELRFAIEIPVNFGRDLIRGDVPTVGVWIDGGMPFRAETTRGYLLGVEGAYTRDLVRRNFGSDFDALPANLVTRFRYNQDLKSVFAIVPGIIALILVLVPTMLMAVTVVREKELGSITNLYATPVTRFEFLLGKQLPYIAVSFASFLMLVALTIFLFHVPLKGSFAALALGAVLYVWAATALGLLVSAFTRTQVAAVLAATILTILPTVQFSGLITPVSSLTGAAAAMGRGFPAAYFNSISVGTFTKALGFADLLLNYAVLLAFILAFTIVSLVLLRKQEA